MPETASQLRNRVQAHRKSLSSLDHRRIEAALDEQFLKFLRDILGLKRGQIMGMHRPLSWEWSFPRSLAHLKSLGAGLAYPRLREPSDRHQGLAWHLADESVASEWKPCVRMKSLLEPRETLPEIDPAGMAGVWVPGVAFSERGERMGTGGGFYDVFLDRHSRLIKVAAAADFQLFSELPGQREDEPRMSHIVCEKRILSFTGDE